MGCSQAGRSALLGSAPLRQLLLLCVALLSARPAFSQCPFIQASCLRVVYLSQGGWVPAPRDAARPSSRPRGTPPRAQNSSAERTQVLSAMLLPPLREDASVANPIGKEE